MDSFVMSAQSKENFLHQFLVIFFHIQHMTLMKDAHLNDMSNRSDDILDNIFAMNHCGNFHPDGLGLGSMDKISLFGIFYNLDIADKISLLRSLSIVCHS